MDSKRKQIEILLDEGQKYTFENFSDHNLGHEKQYGGRDAADWLAWKARVSLVVKNLTSRESAPNHLCAEARGIVTAGNFAETFKHQKGLFVKALQETYAILENDLYGESAREPAAAKSPALSNRVFVLGGHDSALKTELEAFLKNVGLDPIVLHRQADEGKTIMEQFDKHSDVGYAFILLTPDEISYPADQEKVADANRRKEFRTRPNVIFEFGYIVGRLDRSRVCCILLGDVTKPSDVDGFTCKKAGDGGMDAIAYAIINDLKAAGYTLKL